MDTTADKSTDGNGSEMEGGATGVRPVGGETRYNTGSEIMGEDIADIQLVDVPEDSELVEARNSTSYQTSTSVRTSNPPSGKISSASSRTTPSQVNSTYRISMLSKRMSLRSLQESFDNDIVKKMSLMSNARDSTAMPTVNEMHSSANDVFARDGAHNKVNLFDSGHSKVNLDALATQLHTDVGSIRRKISTTVIGSNSLLSSEAVEQQVRKLSHAQQKIPLNKASSYVKEKEHTPAWVQRMGESDDFVFNMASSKHSSMVSEDIPKIVSAASTTVDNWSHKLVDVKKSIVSFERKLSHTLKNKVVHATDFVTHLHDHRHIMDSVAEVDEFQSASSTCNIDSDEHRDSTNHAHDQKPSRQSILTSPAPQSTQDAEENTKPVAQEQEGTISYMRQQKEAFEAYQESFVFMHLVALVYGGILAFVLHLLDLIVPAIAMDAYVLLAILLLVYELSGGRFMIFLVGSGINTSVALFVVQALMGGARSSGMLMVIVIQLPLFVVLYTNSPKQGIHFAAFVVLLCIISLCLELTGILESFEIQRDITSDVDATDFAIGLLYANVIAVTMIVLGCVIHLVAKMNTAVAQSQILLKNVLPFSVQAELQLDRKGLQNIVAHTFPAASLFFCDMVSFTTISSEMDPNLLVYALNYIFSTMDRLTVQYGVEKIKTIGDSYMAATGLFEEEYLQQLNKQRRKKSEREKDNQNKNRTPSGAAKKFRTKVSTQTERDIDEGEWDMKVPSAWNELDVRRSLEVGGDGEGQVELYEGNHAQRLCRFAIHVRDTVKIMHDGEEFPFRMRFGIHSGPVVAGVIGIKKFQFDVWGDTVNTASRMESSGVADHVHVSQTHATLLEDRFVLLHRGDVEVKGKGVMQTFIVLQESEASTPPQQDSSSPHT
eukprot:Nk52_evm14s153 gene=Nk52_evmTU14s153